MQLPASVPMSRLRRPIKRRLCSLAAADVHCIVSHWVCYVGWALSGAASQRGRTPPSATALPAAAPQVPADEPAALRLLPFNADLGPHYAHASRNEVARRGVTRSCSNQPDPAVTKSARPCVLVKEQKTMTQEAF